MWLIKSNALILWLADSNFLSVQLRRTVSISVPHVQKMFSFLLSCYPENIIVRRLCTHFHAPAHVYMYSGKGSPSNTPYVVT